MMSEIMNRKLILPDGSELNSVCSLNPEPINELTGKVIRFWADVESNGISVFAENKRLSERIKEVEEALIKASVRADFFGDCMNNLDITTEADMAAGEPLFEEVNPVLESIADEKKRYNEHYDAALARWKAEHEG